VVPTAYSVLNRTGEVDREHRAGHLKGTVRVLRELGQQDGPPAEPTDEPVHHLHQDEATAAATTVAMIVLR
jgi:hypothetical protein